MEHKGETQMTIRSRDGCDRRIIAAFVFCAASLVFASGPEPATDASPGAEINVLDSRIMPLSIPEGPVILSGRLQCLPGTAFGRQGGHGGQVDMAIRGSSFSEAGISLEGVAVRNHQTEHFNLEWPFPATFFEQPRVLTGLEEVTLTPGHPAGSVGLDLGKIESGGFLRCGLGERGWNWQEVEAGYAADRHDGIVGGAKVFVARECAETVDEAGNGLDRAIGSCHLQAEGKEWRADFAAGHQEKTFDATGFYGAPKNMRADERVISDAVLLRHAFNITDGRLYATVLWQAGDDRYRMKLLDGGLYENTHSTERTAGAVGGFKTTSDGGWGLDWRIGTEYEAIESVRLGNHSRSSAECLVMPNVTIGPARLSAGGRGVMFDGEDPALLGAVGVDFKQMRGHRLFASWTQTVRQPSYTELNYNSPVSLGRAGLRSEEMDRFEGGWRFAASQNTECGAALFQYRGKHVVDWIKPSPEDRWTAADIGNVATKGAECFVKMNVHDRFEIGVAYTLVDRDIQVDMWAGRYVADYPKHLVNIRADVFATETISAGLLTTLRWQASSQARERNDFGAEGSAVVRWRPRSCRAVELIAACENFWDEYVDVPVGTAEPVRRASLAVSVAWR